MRALGIAALVLALVPVAASAADDPLATAYGNTMVIVDNDGVESHLYYNANHTFKGRVPSADYDYKGTWKMDDSGTICRTYSETIPGVPNPDCDAEPATSHNIGDGWTSTSRGKTYTITIKPGIM